jgi:hypothetical protein
MAGDEIVYWKGREEGRGMAIVMQNTGGFKTVMPAQRQKTNGGHRGRQENLMMNQ